MMRILFVASQYLNGRREYGPSFERSNFLHCLEKMGHEVLPFDPVALVGQHGRAETNRRLAARVRAEQPDLLFAVPIEEELDEDVVRRITAGGETTTLAWFCDDHHRFEAYSRRWAPCFHRVVTTAHSVLPRYQAAGITNVIASQWASNPFLYRKLDLPLRYEVTFVGALHGNRREMLQALREAGLAVRHWGVNAPAGRLTTEEMIAVFNQSRINLNFSGASVAVDGGPAAVGRGRAVKRFVRRLPVVGTQLRRLRARLRSRALPAEQVQRALAVDYVPQIKGRNFEIPACGGFQLTGRAENLEDYFTAGREIVLFDGVDDLVAKARYYLEHEAERAAIARAGWERCRREHTYVRRFNEIFRRLGLPPSDVDPEAPGSVPASGGRGRSRALAGLRAHRSSAPSRKSEIP